MIKYYKIGRLMLKIESSGCFQETEKIARFCCDAGESDYEIYVDFTSCLPDTVNSSLYETADRVYLPENGVFCCYYKSRENGAGFYASREMQGNKINIAIDEKYRELLRDDVIFSLVGIEELVVENKGFITCAVLNQVFRNLFKSWVIITVCHALLRSRFAEACQPGDMGLVGVGPAFPHMAL